MTAHWAQALIPQPLTYDIQARSSKHRGIFGRNEFPGWVSTCEIREFNSIFSYIFGLEVDPMHRGRGYGRAILHEAIKAITTPCMIATVREDNAFWLAVNRQLGFRDIARIESKHGGYYKVVFRTKQTMLDESGR